MSTYAAALGFWHHFLSPRPWTPLLFSPEDTACIRHGSYHVWTISPESPEGKEPGLECSCPWAVMDSGRFLLWLGFVVLTTAWCPNVEGRFWILLWFLQNCRRWNRTCHCGVVSHGTFYQELQWRFGWACLGTCSHLLMCSLIRITSVVSSAMAVEPLSPLPIPCLFILNRAHI